MEELDCDPFPHNRRCCADTFRFLIRHGNLGAGRLWPDAERAGLGADAGRQSGGGDSVGTRPRPFHYWYLDGKTTDKAWTLALMPSRALARGHGSRAGV